MTDALGSVYGVVDASRVVVSKHGYDVHTARTAVTEEVTTSRGFTGRRQDSSTEPNARGHPVNRLRCQQNVRL